MAYKYYSFIQIEVQFKAIPRIQTNIYKLQCMYLPHSTTMHDGFLPLKLVAISSAASHPIAIAAEREKSLTLLLGQKYKDKIFFTLEESGGNMSWRDVKTSMHILQMLGAISGRKSLEHSRICPMSLLVLNSINLTALITS